MSIKLWERQNLLDEVVIGELGLNRALYIEKSYRAFDNFRAELWQKQQNTEILISTKTLPIKGTTGRYSLNFTEDDPFCVLEVERIE